GWPLGRERRLLARAPREARRSLLERERARATLLLAAREREPQDLSIGDERSHGPARDLGGDVPETRGAVVERAREGAPLGRVLADLDARAVQLRLEGRRGPQLRERLLHRARRLREHWRQRAADLEPERGERGGASAHRGRGDRRQVTA